MRGQGHHQETEQHRKRCEGFKSAYECMGQMPPSKNDDGKHLKQALLQSLPLFAMHCHSLYTPSRALISGTTAVTGFSSRVEIDKEHRTTIKTLKSVHLRTSTSSHEHKKKNTQRSNAPGYRCIVDL